MIKYCNNGVTRLVFLVGPWAFKIPNFKFEHSHFLLGCHCNWLEKKYTKVWDGYPPLGDKIAPTVFCTWFGLLSVQKRVVALQRDLTEEEITLFEGVCSDVKRDNFGLLNGNLVCVDYAQ